MIRPYCLGRPGQLPVKDFASAADLAFFIGIQQKGLNCIPVRLQLQERLFVLDAKALDHLTPQAPAVLRGFLAVELDPVQTHLGRQVLHHCGRFIHEDPDRWPRKGAVGQ